MAALGLLLCRVSLALAVCELFAFQTIPFFELHSQWEPLARPLLLLPRHSNANATPNQSAVAHLLRLCSSSPCPHGHSPPPPPVHMDILPQMRAAGREEQICSAGKSSNSAPKSRLKRLLLGEAQAKGTLCQLPIKAKVYHILMATFVPGYDYMGSCDAISWDKTVDKLVVVG